MGMEIREEPKQDIDPAFQIREDPSDALRADSGFYIRPEEPPHLSKDRTALPSPFAEYDGLGLQSLTGTERESHGSGLSGDAGHLGEKADEDDEPVREQAPDVSDAAVKGIVDKSGVPKDGRAGLEKAVNALMNGTMEDLKAALQGDDLGKFYNQFKNVLAKAGMGIRVTGHGDISIFTNPKEGEPTKGLTITQPLWNKGESRVYSFTAEKGEKGITRTDFEPANQATQQTIMTRFRNALSGTRT